MSENFKPKPSGWVMKHFGITRGKLDKYDELIAPETRSDQQFNKNKYREYRYEDIEQMWYIHMLLILYFYIGNIACPYRIRCFGAEFPMKKITKFIARQ